MKKINLFNVIDIDTEKKVALLNPVVGNIPTIIISNDISEDEKDIVTKKILNAISLVDKNDFKLTITPEDILKISVAPKLEAFGLLLTAPDILYSEGEIVDTFIKGSGITIEDESDELDYLIYHAEKKLDESVLNLMKKI